jgi:hypothetical protein
LNIMETLTSEMKIEDFPNKSPNSGHKATDSPNEAAKISSPPLTDLPQPMELLPSTLSAIVLTKEQSVSQEVQKKAEGRELPKKADPLISKSHNGARRKSFEDHPPHRRVSLRDKVLGHIVDTAGHAIPTLLSVDKSPTASGRPPSGGLRRKSLRDKVITHIIENTTHTITSGLVEDAHAHKDTPPADKYLPPNNPKRRSSFGDRTEVTERRLTFRDKILDHIVQSAAISVDHLVHRGHDSVNQNSPLPEQGAASAPPAVVGEQSK